MVESIEYRGVVYRRYPGKRYFFRGGGGISLHRQIWIDHHGAIPPKHHIHHKDGNRDNNDIANLECLPASEHCREHFAERIQGEMGQRLKAWRDSEKGRRTLRANAYKMHANTPERQCTCAHCGKPFTTRVASQKHCSDACSEAFNFPVATACEICGIPIRVKRNSKKQVRTCSYRCGWALRRKNAGV